MCPFLFSRKMNVLECQLGQVASLCHLTVVILSVAFVVGVLGNGLVLWMTFFRMARTVTTVWFFNLALADFIVLVSLPLAIDNVVSGSWRFGAWACKFYTAFHSLSFFVSIYLLVLISVDRCISVLYPVWARNHRTVQRAGWLAVSLWLVAAAACSPYLLYRNTIPFKEYTYCFFNHSLEKAAAPGRTPGALRRPVQLSVPHALLGFLVPLAIISTSAHLIRTKLRREGRAHSSRPKRLLLLLVGAFFIFWLPFNVALLVQSGVFVQLEASFFPKMMLIIWATFSLGCLNSCLNPFLYVFVGRDFRERCSQSLTSALAKAFGEEGFIHHAGPQGKPPGSDGGHQGATGSAPL
ncbi:putative G-protein coupled receptor 32 [Ctenodactylus gundi]